VKFRILIFKLSFVDTVLEIFIEILFTHCAVTCEKHNFTVLLHTYV